MFSSVLETYSSQTTSLSITSALICLAAALVLGVCIALVYRLQGECTKSFMVSLILLPALVDIVILMVNGNLGTGVAVLGAFGLIRFRSVPGSSKEICFIFFSMATGLACGIGYISFAVLFTVILCLLFVVLTLFHVFSEDTSKKELRITIPEALDYTHVFDELFDAYTRKHNLVRVKTTNLGSMFELTYNVELKNPDDEKAFIDALRCRNGNLTIILGKVPTVEAL